MKKSNPNCFPVLFNDRLKLDVHLNNCIRRAYSKIYMLSKLCVYMDKNSALNLFKTMVLPYIEYGNSFLLGSDLASRNILQRTQNRD